MKLKTAGRLGTPVRREQGATSYSAGPPSVVRTTGHAPIKPVQCVRV